MNDMMDESSGQLVWLGAGLPIGLISNVDCILSLDSILVFLLGQVPMCSL